MNLLQATTKALAKRQDTMITRYRVGVVVYDLYREKSLAGEALTGLRKLYADSSDVNRVIRSLERSGILLEHPDFQNRAYQLLGVKEERVEEIACAIDPFSYVSHLSAMSFHGLSNRLPVELTLSSPERKKWVELAEIQMKKDLGDELENYRLKEFPMLTRLKLSKIGKTKIHRVQTSRLGAFKVIRGRSMRVSTIGRTFLDMLQNPQLCGGMRHVIEVFREYAPTYIMPIVYEVDQYGGPIDKVRAGYILEELLGMQDPTIEKWRSFVSRGGSRKLDPGGEYFPRWSEKWCLSLNMDVLEES